MYYLNMERNDSISGQAYRNRALAEELAHCDPSTLEIWRLYDCVYETTEECLSGNSWYRIGHFSFTKHPDGPDTKYYNGFKVNIFKDGLVVFGMIQYACSAPMDMSFNPDYAVENLKGGLRTST